MGLPDSRIRRTRAAALVACLLLAASPASAISLSNFQLITSSSVPLGCILAYNQPLDGCAMADFTAGEQCSQACQAGIASTQQTLQGVCGEVDAPAGSVLEAALLGTLASMLCGGGDSSTTISSIPASTTSAAAALISSPPSSSDDTSPTSIDYPSTSTTAFAAQQPPTQPTSRPQQTQPQTYQTPQAPPQQPGSTQGGGSPFDAAVSGSRAEAAATWIPVLLLVLSVGFLVAG